MIQSLYHDKWVAWLRPYHDTIDCIMTVEKKVWPLAVSRYSIARAAIRPQQRPRYDWAGARHDTTRL